MPQATFHFPTGFLWGTATAAHQVEGNNSNNNWHAWENTPGKIMLGHKSGLACDWWGGRWKEDLDRAAGAGQNAHRLSIEWSRVQPAADRWDENALDYYRQIVRGALDRGLTPMITLHHFTDPLWLMEQGGWENPETPLKFAAFVRKTAEALKEYTNLWVTLNEPNNYFAFGYIYRVFPPGKSDVPAAFKVACNLLRGHAAAYRVLHDVQKTAQVGIAHHYRPFYPAHAWNPLDRLVSSVVNQGFNEALPAALRDGRLNLAVWNVNLPEVKNTLDWFGVNYYSTENLAFSLTPETSFITRSFPKGVETGDTVFNANIPEGLFTVLRWANRFGLPIYVSENGLEDAADLVRPSYLVQHVHQMWRAITYSWPVKGYFHWTLVDNFEWERGWTQRFGLWSLDPETQVRSKRLSADLFAEICRTNSLSSEMVAKYVPRLLPKLFPE